MASTGHTGPFSDDSAKQHTVVVPADRTATSSSSSSGNPSSKSTTDPAKEDDGTSWKPAFNRKQSWSKQDMKHQLQDRLLQTEEGKDSGYTEK
jgi:hypothetical protein